MDRRRQARFCVVRLAVVPLLKSESRMGADRWAMLHTFIRMRPNSLAIVALGR